MRTVLIPLALLIFIVGCGGGQAAPPLSQSGGSVALQAVPSSIAFGTQANQQATITITGGRAPYTIAIGNPLLLNVAQNGDSLTVAPIASGTTDITVKDASATSLTIPATVATCTPPSPELMLSNPADGSNNVPASLGMIWVAAFSNQGAQALSTIPAFALRLVSSDGSSAQGTGLVPTSSTPPPGSATSTGWNTYAEQPINALKAGVTYQVQLTNTSYPCMPPTVLGRFAT